MMPLQKKGGGGPGAVPGAGFKLIDAVPVYNLTYGCVGGFSWSTFISISKFKEGGLRT